MKRFLYTIFSIFIILILMTMNVFAMPINPGDYTSVDLNQIYYHQR